MCERWGIACAITAVRDGLRWRGPRGVRGGEVINSSSLARAFAALALHHLVALLEQALAFAVLAFLLLLDVRAFFAGHDGLLAREGGCVRARWLG